MRLDLKHQMHQETLEKNEKEKTTIACLYQTGTNLSELMKSQRMRLRN